MIHALIDDLIWTAVPDGDPAARSLYRRHYSCRHYADGRIPKKFVGPGEYLVLLTPAGDALAAFRKFRSLDKRFGHGVNMCIFRNEGPRLSSDLIRSAAACAWNRWPGQRLYTYVDPRRIRSTNPGYCFLCAGWRRCGVTKDRKLIVLEVCPDAGSPR